MTWVSLDTQVGQITMTPCGYWIVVFRRTTRVSLTVSRSTAHLPVDPLELMEVSFGEILCCNIRKVPDRQEVRSEFYVSHKSIKKIQKHLHPSILYHVITQSERSTRLSSISPFQLNDITMMSSGHISLSTGWGELTGPVK